MVLPVSPVSVSGGEAELLAAAAVQLTCVNGPALLVAENTRTVPAAVPFTVTTAVACPARVVKRNHTSLGLMATPQVLGVVLGLV